jgi:hypothetical protein
MDRSLACVWLLAGLLLTQRCDGSIPRLRLAAGWPAAHPEMRRIETAPAQVWNLLECVVLVAFYTSTTLRIMLLTTIKPDPVSTRPVGTHPPRPLLTTPGP